MLLPMAEAKADKFNVKRNNNTYNGNSGFKASAEIIGMVLSKYEIFPFLGSS